MITIVDVLLIALLFLHLLTVITISKKCEVELSSIIPARMPKCVHARIKTLRGEGGAANKRSARRSRRAVQSSRYRSYYLT